MKSRSALISFVILTAALCALSGCSEKTSTSSAGAVSTSKSTDTPKDTGTTADKAAFDEYAAYNSLERLKADGENYKSDYYKYEDGELVYFVSQYWDSDKLCQEFNNGTVYYYDGEFSFFQIENDGELEIDPVLFGPDGIDKFADSELFFIPEEEQLIETTSDQNFVAVTEVTEKEHVDFSLSGLGVEYEEGMGIRTKYTFDKDNKKLLELETSAFCPDGHTQTYYRYKYSYNVDFPNPFESEEAKVYAAAAGDPAQCRNIKVTYAPDTDKEQTIEYSIPKGYSFYIFTDDYVADKYTDRECTKVYENSVDAVEDLELFVPLG